MKTENNQHSEYDLKSVKLPYLSGFLLRLMVFLIEGPLKKMLIPSLFKNAGITWLRKQEFADTPTSFPIHFVDKPVKEEYSLPKEQWPTAPSNSGQGFHFTTIFDYAKAYRGEKISPENVAEKVLKAIEISETNDPPLRAFIAINKEDLLRQAKESAERLKSGQPLSILDGVPIAIKDELDMKPFPTTVGTSFLGKEPATDDATVVARLRAVGALLIGKTNMHEIGIGVTGQNPHHGTPRNPYNPSHYTGGSSSGPATAVAAGFCPVAIGADGGGSIRTPSSFCGLVGIKSTFGRMSEFGAAPLCWTVAHVGPLAATVADLALTYAVMAGSDPKDPITFHQPKPMLENWNKTDLGDLTLGVYWPWFRHASDDVVSNCEQMLKSLEQKGAKIQGITIPDLEAGRVAHVVTIASEMARAHETYYEKHNSDYSLEVRINLALARHFSAKDYIQAQQVRTRMINNFNNVLQKVDAIISPTNGISAPIIKKSAFPNGDSDLTTLTEIMRFVFPANLTGLPAISFPAGYNNNGLPIGIQAIGRAWQEQTLFRLALVAEQKLKREKPQVHYKILP